MRGRGGMVQESVSRKEANVSKIIKDDSSPVKWHFPFNMFNGYNNNINIQSKLTLTGK